MSETERKTILLVEDEDVVRRLVHQMLTRQGYNVIDAPDPEVALKLFIDDNLRPDLFITDVVMPKMNGRELAAKLLEAQPDLRVLYISGYSQSALEGTADPSMVLLQKPFTMNDLVSRVSELLAS